MIYLSKYKTIIFDNDGVILNTNKLKTDAFFNSAKKIDFENAQRLVNYHKLNGGVSRYVKFKYFLSLLNEPNNIKLDTLLTSYSKYIQDRIDNVKIQHGIHKLKNILYDKKWIVISGSDQNELRNIYKKKEINNLFDSIYGSPRSKKEIFENCVLSKEINYPAVYIGDSKYDYEVSKIFKIDFIFLSDWTEVVGWKNWTRLNNICTYPNFEEILLNA